MTSSEADRLRQHLEQPPQEDDQQATPASREDAAQGEHTESDAGPVSFEQDDV